MGSGDLRGRVPVIRIAAIALIAFSIIAILPASAQATQTSLQFSGQFNLTTTPSSHTYFIWFDLNPNFLTLDGFAQPLGDLSVGNHNFSFTQSVSTDADAAVFGIFGETGSGAVVFSLPTSVATSAVSGGKTFAQIFPDAPAEQTIHDQLAADTYLGQSLSSLKTELAFFTSDQTSLAGVGGNLIQSVQNLQLTSLSGTVVSASAAQNNGTVGYSITAAPEPSALGFLAGAVMLLSLRRSRH
jgi:hypothetical protein